MTNESAKNLGPVLEPILRGAAKLLGCSSANLILFDVRSGDIRVRIGAMATSQSDLLQVEKLLGNLERRVFRVDGVVDTLVYACYRDRAVLETSSLRELAGSAFHTGALGLLDSMLGPHRYVMIPVAFGRENYGVLVFEKHGTEPFSAQQRELLVRYAQRIAAIIHADGHERSPDPDAVPDDLPRVLAQVLLDGEGRAIGGVDERGAAVAPVGSDLLPQGAVAADLIRRARQFMAAGGVREERTLLDPGTDGHADAPRMAVFSRLPTALGTLTLATLVAMPSAGGGDRQHLVRMALGRTAATLLLDPDLRITSWNDATRALFRRDAASLRGRPIGELFREPRDIQGILNRQFLFLSSGYFEEASVLRRGDGSTFPGNVGALLLADDEDRVIGYMVRIRELAAGGAAPAGHESVERLMRRERLATMGEMAAQLAHEIRNPLVALGASLDAMVRDPALGGTNREVLEEMRGELTRLDMLLRDYLSMASGPRAAAADVDLREVVHEVATRMGGLPAAQGCRVGADVPAGLVVRADRDALRHLFFNLMINAVEVVPDGGQVRVTGAREGGFAVIRVEDDGPGLAATADECFEPFFTTKSNGTGLGLTVSRRIVEGAGGSVTLENRREGGCRAIVRLPAGEG